MKEDGELDEEEPEQKPDPGQTKKVPLSLEELLAKKKKEEEEQSKVNRG